MFDFENIYDANSIAQASELLLTNPDSVIIAGGTDVMIHIRNGKLRHGILISIKDIEDLRGISIDDEGSILINAGTTFTEVKNSKIIQEHVPALAQAADLVGGPQIRNVGTIGGNICNGAPSADTVPILLTYNAELCIYGQNGIRTTSLEGFHLGPGRVGLSAGELLTSIRIAKKDYDGYKGKYIKYAMRQAMDIATLSVAVTVKSDELHQILQDVRIAYGVAAPIPLRCHEAENQIKGMEIGTEMFRTFDEAVEKNIRPRDSWRATQAFRIHIAKEIGKRALKDSINCM